MGGGTETLDVALRVEQVQAQHQARGQQSQSQG
jgi:hypothetical protein